jgi:RimJ/RimL family protein N-acetyltransferase
MFTFREPTLDDVDWITEACQDSEILRWTVVPRPYTKDHARSFVADRAGELRAWAIIDSRNERGSGMLGVHHVVDGVASIGYWIAPWARRRGAATAAVMFACQELLKWEEVTAVSATIAETNTASRGVVERAGLVLVDTPPTQTCPDGDAAVVSVVYRRFLETR